MADQPDSANADLRINSLPPLRDPLLILAWEGWNDAGEAASLAADFLAKEFAAAEPFATIDGEEFYDFTKARPMARYGESGEREIEWPCTEFYALAGAGRDIVLGIGEEPHFRWRRYLRAMNGMLEALSPSLVISLGAVASDAPHTLPVSVSGSANLPDLMERYRMYPSRFEGPSGIVGVFHDYCRRREVGGISLWARVPHYLPGIRNPMGAKALVEAVSGIAPFDFDDSPLEKAIASFNEQLEGALRENEELRAYVEHLERADAARGQTSAPPPPAGAVELPPAEELISDLESFLRERSEDD